MKGKASELTARLALLSNGWTVAKPDTDEAFDIVAKDPANGRWTTFQVKTVRVRTDRGRMEYVIDARRSNRMPYTQSDADYLIGVLEAEGEVRVWMTENTGLTEYWSSETRADKRWIKLPLTLDREIYEGETIACPAA